MSDLLSDLQNDLKEIQKYDTFEKYFFVKFESYNLKGVKKKIFRAIAKDFYNYARENIIITAIKYKELAPLFGTDSASYMGKYGNFNKVRLYF